MKNKKGIGLITLVIIIAVILVIGGVILFSVINKKSTNEEVGNVTNNNSSKQENNYEKSNLWTISINSKNITLPCKLSELTKAGLKISSEYDYEQIINSQNQTFSMIHATSDGWQEGVFLKIITGNNPTKKEENAIVSVITNMITTDIHGNYDISDTTTKEQFHLKDGISMGASKDEVIKAFGDNYVQNGSEFVGLYDVLTWQIIYREENNSIMFYFKNGVVTTIEVRNEQK